MVKELNKYHFKTSIDTRVYQNSLLIGVFITLILFITDLIYNIVHPTIIGYPIAVILLLGFYYFNKKNQSSTFQYVLLSVLLFVIIDLAWLLGDGSTIINILIYLLFIIFSTIIIPRKHINNWVLFIVINMAGLVVLELTLAIPIYYFDNKLDEHQFVIGHSLVVMGAALAILMFFRGRFDQERLLLIKKSLELERLSQHYQNKNQELHKYNKDIQVLNDHITIKNKELKDKRQKINYVKANLEKRVQRRTKRLKKRNTEQDLIFYQSSHDFRRPLTSLLGLKEFAELTADGDAKELLQLVGQTANEMDNMLQKFLMLYRINHYKEKSEGLSIKEVLNSIEKEVKNKGAQLEIKHHCENKNQILKRNYLIKVILHNLIENALIYTKPDTQPRIKIIINHSTNGFLISVKDYGVGIPVDYYDKIYSMYFKGNAKSNGNGLGLYVVKRAVETLGASIKLTSKEAEFTKFTIEVRE